MILIKNKSKFFPLVFSSLMLSLSLICAMISNVIPFVFGASFLRFDVGIAFISMAFFVSGWKYGLLVLLSNFIIHPFLPGTNIGFIELFLIGKTIFFITCSFYVLTTFIGFKIIKKNNSFFVFLISIITTTTVMTALNGLIFTPIFLNLISNGGLSMNFIELMEQYKSSFLPSLFIAPDYWGGIVLVYGSFNLVSLSVNSFILSSLFKKIKN